MTKEEKESAKRMNEFFETTSYVGEIKDWKTMPELGTSEDEGEE